VDIGGNSTRSDNDTCDNHLAVIVNTGGKFTACCHGVINTDRILASFVSDAGSQLIGAVYKFWKNFKMALMSL
jgi:hypothetical protein